MLASAGFACDFLLTVECVLHVPPARLDGVVRGVSLRSRLEIHGPQSPSMCPRGVNVCHELPHPGRLIGVAPLLSPLRQHGPDLSVLLLQRGSPGAAVVHDVDKLLEAQGTIITRGALRLCIQVPHPCPENVEAAEEWGGVREDRRDCCAQLEVGVSNHAGWLPSDALGVDVVLQRQQGLGVLLAVFHLRQDEGDRSCHTTGQDSVDSCQGEPRVVRAKGAIHEGHTLRSLQGVPCILHHVVSAHDEQKRFVWLPVIRKQGELALVTVREFAHSRGIILAVPFGSACFCAQILQVSFGDEDGRLCPGWAMLLDVLHDSGESHWILRVAGDVQDFTDTFRDDIAQL